jgi:Tol biopolymer transport system component
MQIWRMHTDGSGEEQVTHDATEDWFAHPSLDGKSIVFFAYSAGTAGHPGSKDVTLQVMPATGGEPHLLAKLWGGKGTINVPSWSSDSTKVAFVRLRHPGRRDEVASTRRALRYSGARSPFRLHETRSCAHGTVGARTNYAPNFRDRKPPLTLSVFLYL